MDVYLDGYHQSVSIQSTKCYFESNIGLSAYFSDLNLAYLYQTNHLPRSLSPTEEREHP